MAPQCSCYGVCGRNVREYSDQRLKKNFIKSLLVQSCTSLEIENFSMIEYLDRIILILFKSCFLYIPFGFLIVKLSVYYLYTKGVAPSFFVFVTRCSCCLSGKFKKINRRCKSVVNVTQKKIQTATQKQVQINYHELYIQFVGRC